MPNRSNRIGSGSEREREEEEESISCFRSPQHNQEDRGARESIAVRIKRPGSGAWGPSRGGMESITAATAPRPRNARSLSLSLPLSLSACAESAEDDSGEEREREKVTGGEIQRGRREKGEEVSLSLSLSLPFTLKRCTPVLHKPSSASVPFSLQRSPVLSA